MPRLFHLPQMMEAIQHLMVTDGPNDVGLCPQCCSSLFGAAELLNLPDLDIESLIAGMGLALVMVKQREAKMN